MLGMGFRGEASSTTIPAPGLGDGRAWGTKAGRAAHREAEVKPGRPRGLASTNQTASMSPPHRRNTAPSAPIVTHAGLRGRRAIATQDMRRLRPATPAPPRTAHVAPIRIVLFILPLLPACPTRLSAGRRGHCLDAGGAASRCSRPQSEQLALRNTAFWGWSWEAGFSSVSASPGVWSPLAGCAAFRLPDRPRNVHLDCALRPSSSHVWKAGRGPATVPPAGDGMRVRAVRGASIREPQSRSRSNVGWAEP
jgi:hypothetical protein